MTQQTKIEFYTNTKQTWDALLEAIGQAKTSIDFEQYIFTVDEIGRKFIELFIEKAKQGVKVRLLLDMAGSVGMYRSLLLPELHKLGIEIRFFNPIKAWRLLNFSANFFRDHRKITIIDKTIGFIGGVGIQSDMADWRDTHIKVEGPLVVDFADSFERVWTTVKRGTLAKTGTSRQFVKNFTLLTNSPRFHQRHIYQTLVSNIRNARSYVYLTTPYFIPDVPLFRALQVAARRGVDVRLIVPAIADHLFIDHARETYFTLALKAGIKIYRYQPVMMHAKTAAIDDEWATVGSFNLDSLSFLFNHEANVASTEEDFVLKIKEQFEEDLKSCEQIKYEEWVKRSFRKKFLEFLTWPVHGLL
jgi:cardiolipin synthase